MKQIEKHPAPEKLLQQITEAAINALALGGPERVDELFIRKLCLMFQFPDTEMMEKFSKKLQIVQEKFLVVRSVRWYHYKGSRR